jgi:hypothetical protein
MTTVDIVFDGPPGAVCGRFIEVEDRTGASIRLGEWVQRDDCYWVLRIPDPRHLDRALDSMAKGWADPVGAKRFHLETTQLADGGDDTVPERNEA